MTRDETARILMDMQIAFPSYKTENKGATINLWYRMLSEYSYQAVDAALSAYIASDKSGFAPSIGQIIDKIHVIKNPNDDNGMEAWSKVMKAIQRGAYDYREAYDNLPPMAQKAIGSAEQIHSMAIDEEFNENVSRSNFLKEYRQIAERNAEIAKYPADIRKLMDEAAKRLEERHGDYPENIV